MVPFLGLVLPMCDLDIAALYKMLSGGEHYDICCIICGAKAFWNYMMLFCASYESLATNLCMLYNRNKFFYIVIVKQFAVFLKRIFTNTGAQNRPRH